MTTTFIPQPGGGISFADVKLKPQVLAKIDQLASMDRERTRLIETQDAEGLLDLAKRYQARGMKQTAKAVRAEAEEAKKGN